MEGKGMEGKGAVGKGREREKGKEKGRPSLGPAPSFGWSGVEGGLCGIGRWLIR